MTDQENEILELKEKKSILKEFTLNIVYFNSLAMIKISNQIEMLMRNNHYQLNKKIQFDNHINFCNNFKIKSHLNVKSLTEISSNSHLSDTIKDLLIILTENKDNYGHVFLKSKL